MLRDINKGLSASEDLNIFVMNRYDSGSTTVPWLGVGKPGFLKY